MAGLLTSIQTAGGALRVLDRGVSVSQNNVNNASTPGWASLRMDVAALSFNLDAGNPGGLREVGVSSSRQLFTERNVQRESSQEGFASARSEILSGIEASFSADNTEGIPGALTQLFASFSAWSAAPNDVQARQEVLNSADRLARSFNQAARQVDSAISNVDSSIESTAEKINALGASLAGINREILQNGGVADPGLQAQQYAALEELSRYTDFTTLDNADGTMAVLVGGQAPLVMGEHANELSVVTSSDAGTRAIDVRLADFSINQVVTGGRLGGLLSARTGELQRLAGEGGQPGMLARLANSTAARVNSLLGQGQVTLDPTSPNGAPLFLIPANASSAAKSLVVNGSLGPGGLAAIAPGSPPDANGIARQLAALQNSTSAVDQIDGQTYLDFYAGIATAVGSAIRNASAGAETAQDALLQARNLRAELSGVSLDEEASRLVVLQRSYQASAQVLQIINELAGTLLDAVAR